MRNFENVLTNSCILVNRASGASTRIFEILDAKSDIHHDPESPQSEEEDFNSFDGSMILKNVSFSYPSRPEAKVLKEVSINIEKFSRLQIQIAYCGLKKNRGPINGNCSIEI